MISRVVKTISQRFRAFRNDDQGSATVEALLWVPVIGYFMIMIADVSFVFYGKAQALRIVQDANRAYSVGYLNSSTATEDRIKAVYGSMFSGKAPKSVSTTVVDGVIVSTIEVPAINHVSIGQIPFITNLTVTVTSQHYEETALGA